MVWQSNSEPIAVIETTSGDEPMTQSETKVMSKSNIAKGELYKLLEVTSYFSYHLLTAGMGVWGTSLETLKLQMLT